MIKRKNKASNKLPPFVPLTWDMLNSEAYRKVKVSFHDPQKYQIQFPFSYTEAKKMIEVASSTHHRVICELVEKGFIDPVDRGGLRGCGRSSSLFKLSERWTKYGTPGFEKMDWRKFYPKLWK